MSIVTEGKHYRLVVEDNPEGKRLFRVYNLEWDVVEAEGSDEIQARFYHHFLENRKSEALETGYAAFFDGEAPAEGPEIH